MGYIYIGKIVATHGINGEIKVLSDFELKEEVFKKDFPIYIGNKYKKLYISSYRKHQKYDMIRLMEYNNINQVITFIKSNIYIDRNDLSNKKILDYDIMGFNVYFNNEYKGVVKDIYNTGGSNKVIEVKKQNDKYLYPWHKDWIENINLEEKYIKLKQ